MKDEKLLQDELLSDDKLEQVAGGTYLQTAEDSFFLNKLNPDFYYRTCTRDISRTPGYFYQTRIAEEWSKYGVKFKWHDGEIADNEYFIDGKKVSREDAYAHAKKIAWHR